MCGISPRDSHTVGYTAVTITSMSNVRKLGPEHMMGAKTRKRSGLSAFDEVYFALRIIFSDCVSAPAAETGLQITYLWQTVPHQIHEGFWTVE